MSTPRHHLLNATVRLLILAILVVPLTIGTALPARAYASPAPVVLGAAGNFAILSKAGITNVPTSSITGDLGTSPITDTAITGFSLVLHSSGTYSTSSQVTGKVYAAEYTEPTTSNLTTAVSNMEAAYTDAATRAGPDSTEFMAGILDGQTLAPGLYKWGTGVSLGLTGYSTVTLSGSPDDVWIFQIDGNLTLANGSDVLLAGGARPENIFWQVAGGVGVEIGTYSHMEGTILAIAAINLRTGASLNGRALAQTEVTLQMNTIVATPGSPSDFDCDGDTDIGVYRPSTGEWLMQGQLALVWGGVAGDVPVPADYNGDGCTDVAIFRPSTGMWYVKDVFNSSWGTTGDVPVPGDYDGDGDADVAFWRPSDGNWYVKNQFTSHWGASTDIPVQADYDGDNDTDLAVFRPSTGVFYIKNQVNKTWGSSTDIPVPEDFNGDGAADLAIWRPSTGVWYVKGLFNATWGSSTDIPVPADYDADGDADVAVFRPLAQSIWLIKGLYNVNWGTLGDFPLPAPDTNGDGDPYQ